MKLKQKIKKYLDRNKIDIVDAINIEANTLFFPNEKIKTKITMDDKYVYVEWGIDDVNWYLKMKLNKSEFYGAHI